MPCASHGFQSALNCDTTRVRMGEQADQSHVELARYIIERKININTSAVLTMEDLFAVVTTNPTLLMLDGLDEVPNLKTRQSIVEHLRIFVNRVEAADGDLQIIFSSRPKGYAGEFDQFSPLVWEVNDLAHSDFDDYSERWLERRIRDADERVLALQQIAAGMQAEAVRRLATSLLQATVMLTIVRLEAKDSSSEASIVR